MPFCPKCGTEYEEGLKFCGSCGTSLDGSVAPIPVTNKQPGFFQKLLDTTDYTDEMEAADITSHKAMAILCYSACAAYILLSWFNLSWLGILLAIGLFAAPFAARKKSGFTHFHLGQSATVLFVILLLSVIENALAGILYSVIFSSLFVTFHNYAISVIMGFIASGAIHLIFMCIPVFLLVVGIINSAKGKAKELPILDKIGKFEFKK